MGGFGESSSTWSSFPVGRLHLRLLRVKLPRSARFYRWILLRMMYTITRGPSKLVTQRRTGEITHSHTRLEISGRHASCFHFVYSSKTCVCVCFRAYSAAWQQDQRFQAQISVLEYAWVSLWLVQSHLQLLVVYDVCVMLLHVSFLKVSESCWGLNCQNELIFIHRCRPDWFGFLKTQSALWAAFMLLEKLWPCRRARWHMVLDSAVAVSDSFTANPF